MSHEHSAVFQLHDSSSMFHLSHRTLTITTSLVSEQGSISSIKDLWHNSHMVVNKDPFDKKAEMSFGINFDARVLRAVSLPLIRKPRMIFIANCCHR